MIKVKWTDRVGNDEVLTKIGEEIQLLKVIKKIQLCWSGHILPKSCLQIRIAEEKLEGKRGLGRRKVKVIDEIRNERSYRQMNTGAWDRHKWTATS